MEGILEESASLPMQFVLYEHADKTKIVGFDKSSGHLKSKGYPKNTVSWLEAKELCQKFSAYAPGFYTVRPYIFLDLDGVVDSLGNIHPIALEILNALPKECYFELSLSKSGIHVIFKGDWEVSRPINHALDTAFWGDNTKKTPNIEIYGEKKFCALTFIPLEGYSNDLFSDLPFIDVSKIPYTSPFLTVEKDSKELLITGSRHEELLRLNRVIYTPGMQYEEFKEKTLEAAKLSMPTADFTPFYTEERKDLIQFYEANKNGGWKPASTFYGEKNIDLLPEKPDEFSEKPDGSSKKVLSYKHNPSQVAEEFILSQRCFTETGKKFTLWNENRWALEVDPLYLCQCVHKFVFKKGYNWKKTKDGGIDYTLDIASKDIKEIVEHIRMQCVERFDSNPQPNTWFSKEHQKADPYIIPVQNGLYSIKQDKLVSPHTIEFYNTGVVPCDWNPEAPASRFLDGLHLTFSGEASEEAIQDNIDCLQLWFGYLFLAGYSEKKLCILLGDANSGKSTLMRIMETLVGQQYYKALSLRELDGRSTDFGVGFDSHFLGGFDEFPFDKKLNSLGDMIKMCTGDTKITQRRLYNESSSVDMLMRFVFTSNTSPEFFSDPLGGLMNRFLIWKCSAVPREKVDMTYLSYLKDNELSGILVWAVRGAQRILKGEHLRQAGGESGELHADFRASSRTFLEQWVEEAFCESSDGKVENIEMVEKFHSDLRTRGLELTGLTLWYKEHRFSYTTLVRKIRKAIKDTVFPNVQEYENHSKRGLKGIKARLIKDLLY